MPSADRIQITLGHDTIATLPMPDALPLYVAVTAILSVICYLLATR